MHTYVRTTLEFRQVEWNVTLGIWFPPSNPDPDYAKTHLSAYQQLLCVFACQQIDKQTGLLCNLPKGRKKYLICRWPNKQK